jgi:hypothetical protein
MLTTINIQIYQFLRWTVQRLIFTSKSIEPTFSRLLSRAGSKSTGYPVRGSRLVTSRVAATLLWTLKMLAYADRLTAFWRAGLPGVPDQSDGMLATAYFTTLDGNWWCHCSRRKYSVLTFQTDIGYHMPFSRFHSASVPLASPVCTYLDNIQWIKGLLSRMQRCKNVT